MKASKTLNLNVLRSGQPLYEEMGAHLVTQFEITLDMSDSSFLYFLPTSIAPQLRRQRQTFVLIEEQVEFKRLIGYVAVPG